MGIVVSRKALLVSAALGLCPSAHARAQTAMPAPAVDKSTADVQDAPATLPAPDLQDRDTPPPPPSTEATSDNPDEIQFDARQLDYDFDADIVTAEGDVRLNRRSDRLR